MAVSRRDITNKATVGIFRPWRCTLASAQHNPVASAWPISNKYDVTLVLGVGKFDRIRHLLSDRLHWLPVHKRVQFKLCLLAYKAVAYTVLLHSISLISADRCLPSTPDRDSDLRHAMSSSSTGPAPSSVAGHPLSPLRWSGTGCRIISAPSSRSTPLKSH